MNRWHRGALAALLLLNVLLIASHPRASAIYRSLTSGGLPTITLTGDTTGTGAGGSIATTTTKINGVTYTAPVACATLTGTLAIDPQNTTTCASDSNTTVQSTCGGAGVGPLVHYSELARRWGTTAPRLCATTTVLFLSSHTDGTDPVYFEPRINGGSTVVSIQGTAPTVVASGVSITVTAAKNRAAGSNSLLKATLGASSALGQLVENTTHASRAWIYANVSGSTWSMTQPLVKTTIPGFFGPAEVDTWATNDLVNLLTPVSVNLVEFIPEMETNVDAITANLAYLYQLNVFKPQTWSPVYLGNVRVYECSFDRVIYAETGHYQYDGLTLTNDLNRGGMIGIGAQMQVLAGAVTSAALAMSTSVSSTRALTNMQFGRDHILGASGFFSGFLIWGSVSSGGGVYLDAAQELETGILFVATGSQIWGPSNLNIAGNGRLFLNGSSTFTSTLTGAALVSPGLQLNGSSTGCSHTNAAPDVINCTITTTPAHLDAAAGASGFGGNAHSGQLGGGSATNVAF